MQASTNVKHLRKMSKLDPKWKRKVCDMILFIGGPVDWEEGPVDWQAWETWMGDIGYCGRGCVNKVNCDTEISVKTVLGDQLNGFGTS